MSKKKSALKVAALITAACLIGFILMITNSFVGNPLSSAFAEKAIEKYAAGKYPSLGLEIGKVHYNFKENNYAAEAKSKTSIDTHFRIYYRNGKVQRDDYESYVTGKFNTLTRLEDEYARLVIPILSKVPGLENNRAMVSFEKWEYEKASENIKLDMKFDKTLPFQMKVTIRTDLDDTSLRNITGILVNCHKTLVDNGCLFTSYDIFSEYKDVLVMISDVTPADIEGGELEKLLQDAQNYNDESDKTIGKDDKKSEPVKRIRVDIKNLD